MTDAVHKHGALAGIELWHGGGSVSNKTSRLPPLSPSGISWMATHVGFMGNLRSKPMDRTDIRNLLRWQGEAARKARRAGFDILYVYAGMGYLPYEFLLPEWNRRTDAYGGAGGERGRNRRRQVGGGGGARRGAGAGGAGGERRRVRGGAAHQPGGAARATQRAGRVRGARGGRIAGAGAGSMGREDGLEPDGLRTVALLAGRQSRARDRLRQAHHQKA